jgi:hypothetical protein
MGWTRSKLNYFVISCKENPLVYRKCYWQELSEKHRPGNEGFNWFLNLSFEMTTYAKLRHTLINIEREHWYLSQSNAMFRMMSWWNMRFLDSTCRCFVFIFQRLSSRGPTNEVFSAFKISLCQTWQVGYKIFRKLSIPFLNYNAENMRSFGLYFYSFSRHVGHFGRMDTHLWTEWMDRRNSEVT